MVHLSFTSHLRSTVAAVLTLLGGVALVALGTSLAVTQAPDGVRDLRAYEAAPRCPSAPSAPAECRWAHEFTVSSVRLTNSRGALDRVTLTSTDGAKWETSYPSRRPVLDGLKAGDPVTGTIWRGKLTEIAAEGDTQKTQAAPADMRARTLIGALVTVPCGLLMTAASAWRLSRRVTPTPTPGMVATLGLAYGLLFAALFSPLLLGDKGENFWLVAAVWLPQAAILTAVARAGKPWRGRMRKSFDRAQSRSPRKVTSSVMPCGVWVPTSTSPRFRERSVRHRASMPRMSPPAGTSMTWANGNEPSGSLRMEHSGGRSPGDVRGLGLEGLGRPWASRKGGVVSSRIGEVRVGWEIVGRELGGGPVWWPDGDETELSEEARASFMEVIRRAYPGWRVFVSDRGRWWATRGPLNAERMRVGCQASLDADTPARLCELLAVESARDQKVLGTAYR